MGWEWRVFYNIRKAGAEEKNFTPSQSLPELLKIGPLPNDNDPRTDSYFLLDFPSTPSKDPDALPLSPRTVGLKLRGGARFGLEIKILKAKKSTLLCEKWEKLALEPNSGAPEGLLAGFKPESEGGRQHTPEEYTALLREQYSESLGGLLPLGELMVRGLAKISKSRSMLKQPKGMVRMEHTLLRIESDSMPGVVFLVDSFAVDGKKDPVKEFLTGHPEAAADGTRLVMSYPELLYNLFVAKTLQA